MMRMHGLDVVVVGAGFAGLVAATELQQLGYDVAVLEARDRVGGKTESQRDACGRLIDTGGQFVSDDMPNVLALIARHDKHLVVVDHERAGRAFVGRGAVTHDPVAQWQSFERAEAAYASVWDLVDQLPDALPDLATSLGSWFASIGLDDDALRAARSALTGVMCIDVDLVPLAHVVDLARRTPLTRDELQYIVAETLHSVAEHMANELSRPVQLAAPVRSVEVKAGAGAGAGEASVIVRTDHDEVRARHVVIAVPPTALRTMVFSPPLPAATRTAAAAFSAGSVMKFLVRYDRAFWRRDDLGSTAVWIDPAGLYVGEASLDDESPMLVAFIGGPTTESWRRLGASDRRAALLERLIEAYGPDAATPTSFVERDWSDDPWGGGGYWNVLLEPHTIDAVETLLCGAPGITFASTELSSSFPGYVEGAITAGRAAAATVATGLALG